MNTYLMRLGNQGYRDTARTCCALVKKENAMAKQKLKTHKMLAKRTKVTGSGKVVTRKMHHNKYRRNNAGATKKAKNLGYLLKKSDQTRIKHLLPYAGL